jgi:hypothetical protein
MKYNDSSFTDGWGSATDVALENSAHPSLSAADIMMFGNGRYVGTYDGTTLDVQALDFESGSEVVDLAYTRSLYWIAVNWPNVAGNNNNEGRIYLWDGTSTSWEDSITVGGRIGCIWAEAGTVFVIFEDPTNGVCKIGYVSGNSITVISGSEFYGGLPLFYQKAKYKNFTIFNSSEKIMAFGAPSNSMSAVLFPLASSGGTTGGGLSCPFNVPLTASNTTTNYRIAQLSGYSTSASWKSLMFSVVSPGVISIIDKIEVHTNILGTGARVDLTVNKNQGASSTTAWQITEATTRHIKDFGDEVEDFRVELDWANGSTTNSVKIKHIFIRGHFKQIN